MLKIFNTYFIILFNTYFVFKKQMLQGANTYIFNPLVPKAHNSVSKSPISFTS